MLEAVRLDELEGHSWVGHFLIVPVLALGIVKVLIMRYLDIEHLLGSPSKHVLQVPIRGLVPHCLSPHMAKGLASSDEPFQRGRTAKTVSRKFGNFIELDASVSKQLQQLVSRQYSVDFFD